MTLSRSSNRPSFTLVEMLVVITIIGILVAILVPTLSMAIRAAKTGATGSELDQLATAVEEYKLKNSDYFPDFTNATAVLTHVKSAYPRYNGNAGAWFTALKTAANTNAAGEGPDPAEALVFWLSQTVNNKRDPLGGVAAGEPIKYFDFDETRLRDDDGDGLSEYYPKHAPGAPYVYFDGRVTSGTYLYRDTVYPFPSTTSTTGLGVTRPYRSSDLTIDARDSQRTKPATTDNGNQWIAPAKFQIICSGLDNHFGGNFAVDPNAAGFPVYKQFPQPNYAMKEDTG